MKSICHYSLFFYRLIPFSFFCGMLPSPIFCVPSQFVNWSAQPLEPPSETYVSALHDSEKSVNGIVCELNFIRGEEFCPTGDTFLLEVCKTIPRHTR